jgi:hypothetical protein
LSPALRCPFTRAGPSWSRPTSKVMSPLDSRMTPDLPRGTGKLIGGDLDVDDEGSEQHRFKSVQSLHHDSVGYQPVHT